MEKETDVKAVQQAVSNESKILEAAEKEFLLKGFDDARTTVIAEQAGVTQPMLNYYFRTKEKLFERVIADKFDSLCDVLFDLIDESRLPVTQRIVKGALKHFDFVSRNRELPFFIFTEARRNPERLRNMLDPVRGKAAKIVCELQNEINREAGNGRCLQVNALMLLHDILALNLNTFVALPAMRVVFGSVQSDEKQYIRRRREEIEQIITMRISVPC